MCHVSHVMCHMSHVTFFLLIFPDIAVKLIKGRSVNNKAYPVYVASVVHCTEISSFLYIRLLLLYFQVGTTTVYSSNNKDIKAIIE